MLISVCLPTYNGREFVGAAIESVLSQSHSELELVVCDDASTDGTEQIVQTLAAGDKRIRFQRNEVRLGLFANYNKCVGLSQGRYIKPLAQDDELAPAAVEEMAAGFAQEPGVVLVCAGRQLNNAYAADQADKAEVSLFAGRSPGRAVILECLKSYRNLIGEPVAVMCDESIKKFPFDSSFHSLGDLDCWLRLLETGDLFHIDRPLVKFHQHEASATMSMMKNMDWVLDFYQLSKRYEKYLSDLQISRDQYCMRFTELAGTLIDKMVQSGKLNVNELDGFREVAYYSMRRCAELSFKSREYDSVIQSTSWRMTEPLRGLIKLLQRG
jgi:glycosyltransferase involved in cell wall biosynthesis